jgi:proteic killer suppression protein
LDGLLDNLFDRIDRGRNAFSEAPLGWLLSRFQSRGAHITLDVHHARRAARLTCSMPRVTMGTVIRSFKCADTEALSKGNRVRRFVNIESVARRKLRQLQIAGRLKDLMVPPGNRLEALKGERAGQHSIRVNDQYRVCFRWTAAGSENVEIVDYYRRR